MNSMMTAMKSTKKTLDYLFYYSIFIYIYLKTVYPGSTLASPVLLVRLLPINWMRITIKKRCCLSVLRAKEGNRHVYFWHNNFHREHIAVVYLQILFLNANAVNAVWIHLSIQTQSGWKVTESGKPWCILFKICTFDFPMRQLKLYLQLICSQRTLHSIIPQGNI